MEADVNSAEGDRLVLVGGTKGTRSHHQRGVIRLNSVEEGKPENMENSSNRSACAVCYSAVSFLVLFLTFLLVQLSQNLLVVTSQTLSNDVNIGDMACQLEVGNGSSAQVDPSLCSEAATENTCLNLTSCEWVYSGEGWQLDVLTGAPFVILSSLVGILVGCLSDCTNRKKPLVLSVILVSVVTIASGSVRTYWHIVLSRVILGLGIAGVVPISVSLLGSCLRMRSLALCLCIYSWGYLLGLPLATIFSDTITPLDLLEQSWRMCYYITGWSGLALALVLIIIIKDAPSDISSASDTGSSLKDLLNLLSSDSSKSRSCCGDLKGLGASLCSLSFILLCLAGATAAAADSVWRENEKAFMGSESIWQEHQPKYVHVLPQLVACLGVLTLGWMSDRLAGGKGTPARLYVIVLSLLVCAVCVVLSMVVHNYQYYILLPSNFFGYVWMGISLVILLECISDQWWTTCTAIFLVIIYSAASSAPALAPMIQQQLIAAGLIEFEALKVTVLIMYPGGYLISICIYLLTMCTLKRDVTRMKASVYTPITGDVILNPHLPAEAKTKPK